jgi:hypothetical protein
MVVKTRSNLVRTTFLESPLSRDAQSQKIGKSNNFKILGIKIQRA